MLAPSTSSCYRTGLLCFKRFLLLNNACISADVLPQLSEELMLFFVTHCHVVLRLAFTTIKLYVSGIKFAYMQAGFSNPFHHNDGTPFARLLLICRAIRKVQPPRMPTRLPITSNILEIILSVLGQGVFSPFTDIMLQCACSVAFYGFLRCGEFTTRQLPFNPDLGLCIGDVSLLQNKVSVTLKSSKTDPFRKGVTIHVFRNHSSCPVSAMSKYLRVRLHDHYLPSDPLFVCANGTPLTRNFFISCLKILLEKAGINPSSYSGHSFRLGAATTAAACSIEDHLIKTLGRWSSDSYCRYIKVSDAQLERAQLAMSSV